MQNTKSTEVLWFIELDVASESLQEAGCTAGVVCAACWAVNEETVAKKLVRYLESEGFQVLRFESIVEYQPEIASQSIDAEALNELEKTVLGEPSDSYEIWLGEIFGYEEDDFEQQ